MKMIVRVALVAVLVVVAAHGLRRDFLNVAPLAAGSLIASGIDTDFTAGSPAYAQAPFADEKSKLNITGVRLVQTRPRRPVPAYTPAPGAWSTNRVEVANPMSIYPEYKATRSLFQPDPGKVPGATIEISTDKGIKGYGSGGPGAGYVIEQHLTKLLLNEDPFNIECLWDIMWRSTMSYGRMGVVINAISAVDLALWDIVGKALNMPVYKQRGSRFEYRNVQSAGRATGRHDRACLGDAI